jgi:hypothetical protein
MSPSVVGSRSPSERITDAVSGARDEARKAASAYHGGPDDVARGDGCAVPEVGEQVATQRLRRPSKSTRASQA